MAQTGRFSHLRRQRGGLGHSCITNNDASTTSLSFRTSSVTIRDNDNICVTTTLSEIVYVNASRYIYTLAVDTTTTERRQQLYNHDINHF